MSNLKYLNGKTQIRLVQLADADDVNADGSMSLVDPYLRPYDFAVAGDSRTFADLLSNPEANEPVAEFVRSKIDEGHATALIQTVRGLGYLLEVLPD